MDEVFDDLEVGKLSSSSLPPPPPPGKDLSFLGVVNDLANDMSRDIVTSSLSSFSPVDDSQHDNHHHHHIPFPPLPLTPPPPSSSPPLHHHHQNDSFDIPDEDFNHHDRYDCCVEGERGTGSGIIEDWEPETSESGSYVIEGFDAATRTGELVSASQLSGDDYNFSGYNDATTARQDDATTTDFPLFRSCCEKEDEKSDGGKKHAMALVRLMELISTSEPFLEKNLRPSTSKFPHELNRTVASDDSTSGENAKFNAENWIFRLDRLLRKLESTNEKVVRALCQGGGGGECVGFEDLQLSDEEKTRAEETKKITRPEVEFNRGLHCTEVSQAQDILTTKYKLSDVNKKRSIISWSRWNVSHIVRGPHEQSPIWQPGFMVEMEKSRKIMEELNHSIETKEANLQKLAEGQTVDFYAGLAMRHRHHQQHLGQRTYRDLGDKLEYGSLKPRKRSREENSHRPFLPPEACKPEVLRSSSLTSLPSAATPHQPQQSDHIKCFTLASPKDLEGKSRASATAKPSIVDFVKQNNNHENNNNNNNNRSAANLSRVKSHSISSKTSDEGYDDDDEVFYRDNDQKALEQKGGSKSRSQPLFNYFGNSQLLQIVSQQNRSRMKKRSQQRRRQIKKKLEDSLPKKQDFVKRSPSSRYPPQQAKTSKQTVNCISGQSDNNSNKFSSLRLSRKREPTFGSKQQTTKSNQSLEEASARRENTNLFFKFYHWFQGKIFGREF